MELPCTRAAFRMLYMTYDAVLADRIRHLLAETAGLTEKEMFGGLAFLINGNMAIAASSQGGILVRAQPDEADRLISSSSAHPMEMGGRLMTGWLRVDAADVVTNPQLKRWVTLGALFATSLPPKL